MNITDIDQPKVHEAISVFIEPLELIKPTANYRWTKWYKAPEGLPGDDILIESQKVWVAETIIYGKKSRIYATLFPKIGRTKNFKWVALIIEAHLHGEEGRAITFDELLSFNDGIRKNEVYPQPDYNHFETEIDEYKRNDGTACADIYKRYADKIITDTAHRPPFGPFFVIIETFSDIFKY